jgi:hypothetical protein
MEIVRQIGFRLTAGYSYAETATMLEQHRSDLQHVEIPAGPISRDWVVRRLAELRREVAETA